MKKIYNKIQQIVIKICNFFDYIFKESILKKFFQFFPNNIFLFLLSLVVIFVSITKIQNNVSYYANYFMGYQEEYLNGRTIEQEIKIDRVNKISGVGFKIATYNKKNQSNYEFKLYKDNELIYKKIFNARDLKYNEYSCFDVGNLKIDKNSKYKITLDLHDKEEKYPLAVGYSSDNQYAWAISNPSEFNSILKILFIILLTIFFIINYLINNKKISKNKFLLLMLFYILPIVFIIPPHDIPDEGYHFYYSYAVSQYDFSKTPYENSKSEVLMPKNINCTTSSYANDENYLEIKDITNCLKSNSKNEYKKVLTPNYNTAIVYLPSVIGIKIADIFTNSPMIIFYSGRLCNFIVSFLILLFAFKIIPKHKNIFLIVVCIPMFIQQMVSYSYDSILNSLCILSFSLILKFHYSEEKIQNKDLIIFSIVSLIIYMIKVPYILIPSLILFINKDKFGSKGTNKYIRLLLIIIGILIISKLYTILLSIGSVKNISTSSAQIPRETKQIQYLINNPRYIFTIIYNTLSLKTIAYIIGLIGNFGWLRYALDPIIIKCYCLFIIIILMSEENAMKFKDRLIGLLFMIVLIGGIFAAMYLSWSEYKLPYVEGVQGRYFLPLISPVIFLLMPKNKIINIKQEFVYSFINIVFVSFIATLFISFY